MGGPHGVLMVNDAGFIKKGKDSMGVARQSCSTLGKVGNNQGRSWPSKPSAFVKALAELTKHR
jgi:hypothetical protein